LGLGKVVVYESNLHFFGFLSFGISAFADQNYVYDSSRGVCVDPASGRNGLNTVVAEVIKQTGEAECSNLTRASLVGINLDGGQVRSVNLRGADLSGANLVFSAIVNADFRGTRLDGISVGYTTLSGIIDAFTVLPAGSLGKSCVVKNQILSCLW